MRRRDVLKATGGTLAVTMGGFQWLGQSDPYQPLGSIPITNAKEAVVGLDSKTAFLAATDGFVTVDISNPTNPAILAEQRDLLAEHENGPLREIWDVKVEGDRLIVAGPANPKAEAVYGFLLYDVSDPTRPTRVAFHETQFSIHNCFIRNQLVYLTGNDLVENPLVIVDVSGNQPEEVGRWSMIDHNAAWSNVDPWLRWLHDVWVADGRAYLAYWDAGTWIIDVSDPRNPVYITHFGARPIDDLTAVPNTDVGTHISETPGNVHYVTVNDDATVLGVGREAWDKESTDRIGGPAGIELWDTTDLTQPTRIASISPPRVTKQKEDRVKAAGFGSIDDNAIFHRDCHKCGNQASSPWRTAHNFEMSGGRLFTSWYQGGVETYDISNPKNPTRVTGWQAPEKTSFWTARQATEEFYVASSMGGQNDGKGGLYTFAT